MKLYPSLLHRAESASGEAQPLVEMNTTPLIDVMLVLLVMLIITIPVPLHAVALDMPALSSQEIPQTVQLHIDAQGFVRWNGQLITELTALETQLKEVAAQPQQPEIHIKPESNTPYALVVSMTAMAQKAGLRKVGVSH